MEAGQGMVCVSPRGKPGPVVLKGVSLVLMILFFRVDASVLVFHRER